MDLWITERYEDQFGLSFKVKETLYHAQSDFQRIDILDAEFYGRMLLLDGMMMTTERDEFIYHEMISHIPLLAHPNPKRVLIIGGGDGGTVREVLKHPSVEQVVLCEIDGLVIDACREFLPTIAGELGHPKVDIRVQDGIQLVADLAAGKYPDQAPFDIVLIDSTDPVGPGEGLFTLEFYQNVYKILSSNGIMVNQSESPWAMQPRVRKIYALLNRVFPLVQPYIATIPTYPGAYWSWAYCSKGLSPLSQMNMPLAESLSNNTRYYNPAIHQAAFALPNFLKALLDVETSPVCDAAVTA